jgi:diguanylate cyclase (GGDEF)-like protein
MPFSPTKSLLEDVFQAHAEGRLDAARQRAETLIREGSHLPDTIRHAAGLYLLARTEQLSGIRPPAELSAMALQSARLFRVGGDPFGEALALSMAATAALLHGRVDTAIEHAVLSTQVAEAHGSPLARAVTWNTLGAACGTRDTAYARDVLQRSIKIANRQLPDGAVVQPSLNLILAELHRLEICLQTRQPAEVHPWAWQAMDTLETWQGRLDGPLPALLPSPGGMQIEAILPVLRAGLQAHTPSPPDPLPPAGASGLPPLPLWLRGIAAWIRARVSLSRNDFAQAEADIDAALDEVSHMPHAFIEQVALNQRAELHERRGEWRLACEALHAFRRIQIRQDSPDMRARERTAALRLAWRQQNRTLDELRTTSRQLERLTLEDPLTGLSNRRHLEQQLAALLATPAAGPDDLPRSDEERGPWCLVMIDIDRFKDINDHLSHVIGDAVLRQLALLLRRALREHDIASRIAGDEFVLVLKDIDEPGARQVVERLRGSVALHDWHTVHADLRVSISLGLTTYQPGDTLDALLHRSDLAMYADKRARRRAPGR